MLAFHATKYPGLTAILNCIDTLQLRLTDNNPSYLTVQFH